MRAPASCSNRTRLLSRVLRSRAQYFLSLTQDRPISSCDFPARTAYCRMVLIRADSQGRASNWMDFDQTPA
jgi:hypothetical protein